MMMMILLFLLVHSLIVSSNFVSIWTVWKQIGVLCGLNPDQKKKFTLLSFFLPLKYFIYDTIDFRMS